MSENVKKEKTSFVDTKEHLLKERAKDYAGKSRAPKEPKEEESMFTYLKEQNIQLARIADALEGKVKDPTKTSPPLRVGPSKKHLQEKELEVLKAGPTEKVIREDKSEKLDVEAPVKRPSDTEDYYVNRVRSLFPDSVNEAFDIVREGDFVKIKSRGYIGGETYATMAKMVTDYNGIEVKGVKEKGKWVSYPYRKIHISELE